MATRLNETGAPETRLDSSRSVSAQILDLLRDDIVRLRLKPGQALSEAEMALRFEVSRQPVREAFIKLREARLVEIRPQRGTFVSRISAADVMDARFVREAIEVAVIREVAETADAEAVEDLRRQVADQRSLVETASGDQLTGFLSLDEAFHRTLASLAGRPHAWSVIEAIKAQMDRVRYLSTTAAPILPLVQQHERVVEAIARGDAEAAEAEIRTHLQEILRDLPEIARANPELFDA